MSLVVLCGNLLGAPALVAPAAAASFDCSKATTSFERAICDDSKLSALDEVLAVAYATATGGLTSEAGTAMRNGQREWLAYVERACTPEGEPLRVAYDADGVACLASEFNQRVTGLEASRMQGGHRFYLVERFLALPRQGDEDWNKVATKSFSAVYLDSTDPASEGFNAFVGTETTEMLEAFSPPAPDAEGAEEVYSTDVGNRVVVDAVSERLIGLKVTSTWYGHGAAHGNYDISYRHYRLDEKRPMVVTDIFAAPAYAEPLAALVLERLKEQFPGEDSLWEDTATAVAGAVADPHRWSFAEDGISVHFQPYEVTSYAAGAPRVLVLWHEMTDWLTEDAEALATY